MMEMWKKATELFSGDGSGRAASGAGSGEDVRPSRFPGIREMVETTSSNMISPFYSLTLFVSLCFGMSCTAYAFDKTVQFLYVTKPEFDRTQKKTLLLNETNEAMKKEQYSLTDMLIREHISSLLILAYGSGPHSQQEHGKSQGKLAWNEITSLTEFLLEHFKDEECKQSLAALADEWNQTGNVSKSSISKAIVKLDHVRKDLAIAELLRETLRRKYPATNQ